MVSTFKKAKENKGWPVGAAAPDFSATDQRDAAFHLYSALKESSVVLVFYRGHWCPFCNRHLKALQDNLAAIESKGARLVAVTPENSMFLKKTMAKTGAAFTLLYDEGYKIAEAYGVNFRPSAVERLMYNTVLQSQLKMSHSDDTEQLPIPATYIISKDGMIKWRHFNPDYKERSKPSDIIKNL